MPGFRDYPVMETVFKGVKDKYVDTVRTTTRVDSARRIGRNSTVKYNYSKIKGRSKPRSITKSSADLHAKFMKAAKKSKAPGISHGGFGGYGSMGMGGYGSHRKMKRGVISF